MIFFDNVITVIPKPFNELDSNNKFVLCFFYLDITVTIFKSNKPFKERRDHVYHSIVYVNSQNILVIGDYRLLPVDWNFCNLSLSA